MIAFRLRLVVRILLAAGLAGVLAACAATPFPADTDPAAEFRDRIQRQEAGGVRVSAAVPSAEESERLFGKKLYKKRIQPVWLKIENERDDPVVFLPVGLDPYYYSPLEVANLDVPENSGSSNLVNEFFMDQGMNLLVPAGESLAGFVFTNLDEGTKAFNVDIRGTGDFFETFTFFIPVPGLRLDHHAVDWKNLLPLDARQDLDTESLIEMLEQKAPCCVEDKAGKDTGDPLNLASRLCSLAQSEEILVGRDTYRRSGGYFRFEEREPTRVKGKAEPVAIYKVLTPKEREIAEDKSEDWMWRVHHAQCPDPAGRATCRRWARRAPRRAERRPRARHPRWHRSGPCARGRIR